MNNRLNKYKYPGAKRLMLEAQELKDNTEDYCAQPLDDNLFEWHFTVRGPPDTAFDGGYYHGRLSFPTEYPMKPPSIILLTPNGRFETNKKICLSISGYHPETWQPSWSVRTALLALIAFMPTKANRAIGSLDFSDAERKKLAQKSRTWRCESCGLIKDLLIQPESVNTESKGQENDSQRPGTSRVHEESSPSSTNVKCNSSNNNNLSNNSDSEKSDITNDTEGSESNKTFSSDEDSSHQSVGPLEDDVPRSAADSPASVHGSSNNRSSTVMSHQIDRQQQPQQHLGQDQSLVEPRRASYPPLVLKSIFILLSLLILRRVVMVIQA